MNLDMVPQKIPVLYLDPDHLTKNFIRYTIMPCFLCKNPIAEHSIDISPMTLYPNEICIAIHKRCHVCHECFIKHGGTVGIQEISKQNKIN
jgi:hypothetical protein